MASLVFWDTNLFIYLIEEHPQFGPVVEDIRRRMLRRGDRLCTSALTLGESLVGPHSRNDNEVAIRYRAAFSSSAIEIFPFTRETGETYAQIRLDPTISRADAIQLACASASGVDLFLTNDLRLSGKYVPGIQFIAGLQNCPL